MKFSIKNALLASSLIAGGLIANAETKGTVAVVDVRSVVEGSKHFTGMQADMQKKLGPKHEELVLAQKNLSKQQEELDKSKQVMAAATYNKKKQELDKKFTAHAEKERAFQEEVMKLQDQSMKKLYGLVKDATKTVAKKQGFNIVLQGEALYVTDQYDITKEVKRAVENSKL
tara:strand:- start:271 stop:786 length:516 start_codon:yes stop_codon:yes gene_type:complete